VKGNDNAKETTMSELKKAILSEIKARRDAASVGVLTQDYGPETHQALRQLRDEGKVRLIAGTFGMAYWREQDGCETSDYIEGGGSYYVRVEMA
jgi:hypothetical protein